MDVIPEQQPTPRWVGLYELGLLLHTASGRVHPLAAYLGWLHDAGFEPPARPGAGRAPRRPQPRRRVMSEPLQPGAAQPICN
jgi:hypothetical protein